MVFRRVVAPTLTGLDQSSLGANEGGDHFGEAVAIGDLDNDTLPDLAVGAPGEAPGSAPKSGYVFLFHQPMTGFVPWRGLDQRPGSNEDDDRFGETLAIGDVSGDRVGDLIVGAPGEDPGPAHGHPNL